MDAKGSSEQLMIPGVLQASHSRKQLSYDDSGGGDDDDDDDDDDDVDDDDDNNNNNNFVVLYVLAEMLMNLGLLALLLIGW